MSGKVTKHLCSIWIWCQARISWLAVKIELYVSGTFVQVVEMLTLHRHPVRSMPYPVVRSVQALVFPSFHFFMFQLRELESEEHHSLTHHFMFQYRYLFDLQCTRRRKCDFMGSKITLTSCVELGESSSSRSSFRSVLSSRWILDSQCIVWWYGTYCKFRTKVHSHNEMEPTWW